MLSDYVQERGDIGLRVEKLEANNSYLFGTKKIQAKVNNGKLLVRVGGGYMSIDEFYELYAE